MAWQLTSLAVVVGAAAYLKRHPGLAAYRIVLTLLIVGHFARLLFAAQLPAWSRHASSQTASPGHLRDLMRSARLRRSLRYSASCSFLAMMSVPSLLLYLMRSLEYGDGTVLLASAAGMTGAFLTFPLWGRLVSRVGETALLLTGAVVELVVLGLWVLTGLGGATARRGDVLWPFALFLFFCGKAGATGLATAFAHQAYRLRPGGPSDAAYEALEPTAQWVAGAMAVFAAGAFTWTLRRIDFLQGFCPYLLLFFLNAVAWLIPLGMLSGPDKETQEIPDANI